MCTHIYICITTYSIRCFNTLFFGKDNGNEEERERIAIDGTEEKETKEEDVFFSGRTARTMAYIDGRVKEKGPP